MTQVGPPRETSIICVMYFIQLVSHAAFSSNLSPKRDQVARRQAIRLKPSYSSSRQCSRNALHIKYSFSKHHYMGCRVLGTHQLLL